MKINANMAAQPSAGSPQQAEVNNRCYQADVHTENELLLQLLQGLYLAAQSE